MSATEEFRKKIKAGEVFEALTLAMSEAIELEITTIVSSASCDAKESSDYLRTRLNLIKGEIENEITSQFIGDGRYKDLLPVHLEQVKKANQIVLNNLESLQKMFFILTNILSQLPPPSSSSLPRENPSLLPYNEQE